MSANDDSAAAPTVTSNRTTQSIEELAELLALCRLGRLFDVQAWIEAGRRLQLDEPATSQRKSALCVAIEAGNHSLVQVLLSSGYDPNLERVSPLTWALADRRHDLVELLLQHACDPRQVCLYELFSAYDSRVLERFYELGVDLAEGHELAAFLAHRPSNRPLYGFVKRHRERDPAIAHELQIALHTSIDEKSKAAIALCLWAGAEARVPAPTLWFGSTDDEQKDGEEPFRGRTAIEHAAIAGNVALLERLQPDPSLDDFDSLYNWIRDPDVLDYMASISPPSRPNAWLSQQLYWSTSFKAESGRFVPLLERAFRNGMRWTEASDEEIVNFRRRFLRLDSGPFQDALRVLCEGEHCSAEILRRLADSQAFRRRLHDEGYFPGEPSRSRPNPRGRRQVLQRLGIALPKRRQRG